MSEAEREKWNARYAARGELRSEPSAHLPELAPQLGPPGTVLDLACGEGRDLVWLARRGWRGTGVDISAAGLERARRLASAQGVEVEWVQAELEGWDPRERRFDLVCCAHFLQRELVPRMRRAVRPGGRVLLEMLLADGSAHAARYRVQPNEVLRWFVDWRVWHYSERRGDLSVARLLAERPGG